MAGHNKWSQIKRKKAKTDEQRGKIFSKIVREILVSAKEGGGDPESNARLRLAIQKGKDANMPADNIKRAIEKGSGGSDVAQLEEVRYEAYGPNGVGIIIDTLTDNKNRTIPNIRSILEKGGGSMAQKGAVAYQFDKKGVLVFEPGSLEEKIMDLATLKGAEDVSLNDDGSIVVVTGPETYEFVRQSFEDAEIKYASGELTMVPQNTVILDENSAKKMLAMIDQLEDDDDVQNVFGNFEIPDDIMAGLLA